MRAASQSFLRRARCLERRSPVGEQGGEIDTVNCAVAISVAREGIHLAPIEEQHGEIVTVDDIIEIEVAKRAFAVVEAIIVVGVCASIVEFVVVADAVGIAVAAEDIAARIGDDAEHIVRRIDAEMRGLRSGCACCDEHRAAAVGDVALKCGVEK